MYQLLKSEDDALLNFFEVHFVVFFGGKILSKNSNEDAHRGTYVTPDFIFFSSVTN